MTGVLVVGASAAGLATAEALRRRGFTGPVRLIGDEAHPPYDRPPLSKKVLSGEWADDRTALKAPADLATLGVDLMLNTRAAAVDVAAREVVLAGGDRLRYDDLVIATGLTARRLPGWDGLSGVHTLRTLADAGRLRAELGTALRVAVIGAGVLGSEIAATARQLGLAVTLIDPAPHPLCGQVGPQVGEMLAELHRAHGVEVLTGVRAEGPLSRDGRVTGVLTSAGPVAADVVVVAAGSVPNAHWAAGSGLTVDDGIVCDSRCRAAPHVYAAGDVARWWHEERGAYVRLENRTNASAQALAVAANILGADQPYLPVPYFWTDQYDVRMQVFGDVGGELRMLEGSPAARAFVAVAGDGDRVTGVVGWNSARGVRQARRLMDRNDPVVPGGQRAG